MDGFLAHFVPFLREVAISAAIEILISLLLEEPTSFYLNILFNPIFTKAKIYSYEGLVCTIYATALYGICQFLKAFSTMPMEEAGDYQMAALYWYPITELDLIMNSMDDEWDYIAPLFATIHHIYMWFRSAYTFIATICSGTVRIIQYIYASVELLLAYCLDLLLPESPLCLIVSSTGLILGDILLAMWAANILVPAHPSDQFNTMRFWNKSSEIPPHGAVFTWRFGSPPTPGYGSKCYPARFATWYNNQHELDEMHHYPAFTGPIALLIIFVGFTLIWGDKPQKLRQVEHTIEETLRKNEITHDFEDYLRKRLSRTDGCKAFLAANLKAFRDVVARNRTLIYSIGVLNGRAQRAQNDLTERAQQLDAYTRECLDLRGVNAYLQTELGRLRVSADVQAHTTHLASANNENVNLQHQMDNLRQKLEAVRGSTETAEAPRAGRQIGTAERRASTNIQELSEQQSTFEREKSATKAAANNDTNIITELRTRNNAMIAHIQTLQVGLNTQEARSAETIRAAEQTAREERTKTVVRNRGLQMRKVHRIRQKKTSNLKILCQEEKETSTAYKNHNQLLEHRLSQLDTSRQGSTQVIHDRHKDNEARKLRDQLERSQARNRILQDEVRNQQETIDQLQRQSVTAATMSPGQQQPSTPRSRAESDEIVRVRTELTHAEEDIRRLRIQVSNLQMQRGGSKSGDPFMRGNQRRR
uniref:Reticulocyte-binding protein 2 like a n=1 Tax=Talaromyces marneffei PM1 TaxID=1077442 RepID=A0A093VJQ6_TALMA